MTGRTGAAPPSPWFVRHQVLVAAAARVGPVLDVACGSGRHTLTSAGLGARAVGLDRDPLVLSALWREAGARGLRGVLAVRAELEGPHPLPVRRGACGAVLVFRYLSRPLARALAGLLRPGGLLLYETFTRDQRELGHGPRNPAFLLEPGELRDLFPELEIVAYEEGRFGERPEALARLAARRPDGRGPRAT